MEQVVDALIAEMNDLTNDAEFVEIMQMGTDAKFDDPGLVITHEYPYIFVAPVSDSPLSETTGMTGYDVRELTINIGIVVNAADYFDPTVSELPASRELVAAAGLVRKRLRRLSRRSLDVAGVRRLDVQQIDYVPDLREDVFVRVALTTVIVERQYQHEA